MALDIKKLKSLQKDLKKKSGQGDSILLFANKLPEELDIRILPPKPNMNGIYFLEQEGWWIGGKFVLIDPDNDVIQEEIDAAKATKDETLLSLINKKERGMPVLKKEVRYSIPILVLDTQYDDEDNLVSCEVKDTKVLIAKPTLMKEINKVVTARPYQNGTSDGIADRVKGYNIIIGKTGSGKQTEYYAMGWNEPMEMPEEYYKDDKIPDILEMYEKALKSPEYQRSVIRNYLYGEPILEDEDDSSSEQPATKKSEVKKPTAKKPTAAKRPTRQTTTKKSAGKPRQRNLLEDALDDMNDLD